MTTIEETIYTVHPDEHEKQPRNYHASENPIMDIDRVSYAGQDPNKRLYKEGYEMYFNQMPVLIETNQFLDEDIQHTKEVMKKLDNKLQREEWIHVDHAPGKGEFTRHIIAIETPKMVQGELKEGAELIVAM